MKVRRAILSLTLALFAVVLAPNLALAQDVRQDEGVEVLTRGPLHEAFAETVTFTPEPGIVVKKSPPEAIEELPPDQKPDGENVAWIPGYWAWDEERDDFLWISGVWRALPPDRQWIGGYWAKVTDGHQWISGYWADAKTTELQYYPEPPKTLETGPSTQSPSAEHIWIPGCWVWHDADFAWRPGYWMVAKANWIWVPSHWVWTPNGCLFVDGYWDYAIPRRGIVFAPVFFAQRVYTQPDYYYSPTVVINPVVFVSHIFLRPAYGHYYFGDYYATNYVNVGIYPRYSYHYRYGFDPLFAYQTWQHREDRGWLASVKQTHIRLQENEGARPPRTFIAAQATLAGGDVTSVVATSLDQVVKNRFTSLHFETMQLAERQQLARSAKEIQQFREERQKLELKSTARIDAKDEPGAAKSKPLSRKMRQSPIAHKSAAPARPEDRSAKREPRDPAEADKTGRRETLKPVQDERGKPGERGPAGVEPQPGTPERPAPSPERPKGPEAPKDLEKGKAEPTEPAVPSREPRSERPQPRPKTEREPRAEREPVDRAPAKPDADREPKEKSPSREAAPRPTEIPNSEKGKKPSTAPRPDPAVDRDPFRETGEERPPREKSPREPGSPRGLEPGPLPPEKPAGDVARPNRSAPRSSAPGESPKRVRTPEKGITPDSTKEPTERPKGAPRNSPDRSKSEVQPKKRPDDKKKPRTPEDEKIRPGDELPK